MKSICEFIAARSQSGTDPKTKEPYTSYYVDFIGVDTFSGNFVQCYHASVQCKEDFDLIKDLSRGDIFTAVYNSNKGYTKLEDIKEGSIRKATKK